ncbi:MAG: PH domain-containing protein [Chloroflexi bacterium]|nr:PH domain-containing protein [Chloroflexota bacterium]
MGRPYREQLLGTGETIVYIARQHAIVLFAAIGRWFLLIGAALAVALVGTFAWQPAAGQETLRSALLLASDAAALVGVLGVGVAYVRWRATEYVVTSRRVIQIEGVLNKHTFDSSLDFINDLHIEQPLLGRLLGYGSVQVLTANEDSDEPSQTYRHVIRPLDFVRAINDQRETRRHPAGAR